MLRSILCTLLAFAVIVGYSTAADEAKKKKKKKAAGTSGTITSVDAEKGILMVKVALKKKQFEDKEFKVTDKTTVTAVEGDDKTELKADKTADLLKKQQFKVGANVTVDADAEGVAKSITIGGPAVVKKKKKNQ
jgi:hypothetical protein